MTTTTPSTSTTTNDLASVISKSHSADNVRVIKDFAVFLLPDAKNLPTSTTWTPPDGVTPVGWATDKGLTLALKAGSTTDIKGHDGSVVKSLTAPGNFTLKIPAMESRKSVAAAYFGVDATDGVIKSNGEAGGTYQVVVAGIDTDGKPVVIVLRDATVTDRDDITLAGGSAIVLGITLTAHTPSDGNSQLTIYSLTTD